MNDRHEPSDPLLGLAAGLAAGVVGALVMTGFQALLSRADITSGVSGPPSTEKAADRLSEVVTGRPVRHSSRPVAGEALHYAVGGLAGGAYGVAAEFVPRVTAGEGAAFGLAAAVIVDETLVPAFGFGDPFWKAPMFSHVYSVVSHWVFGTATEFARRLLRRFFADVRAGVHERAAERPVPRPPLATAGPDGWRGLSLRSCSARPRVRGRPRR